MERQPQTSLESFMVIVNLKHVPYHVDASGKPRSCGIHGELNGLSEPETRTASGFSEYLCECAARATKALEQDHEPSFYEPPLFPKGVRVRLGVFIVAVGENKPSFCGSITPLGEAVPSASYLDFEKYGEHVKVLSDKFAHYINRAAWRAADTPTGESHPIIDYIERQSQRRNGR